jgi:hypothetical protein
MIEPKIWNKTCFNCLVSYLLRGFNKEGSMMKVLNLSAAVFLLMSGFGAQTWARNLDTGLSCQVAAEASHPIQPSVAQSLTDSGQAAQQVMGLSQNPQPITVPGNSFIENMTADPSSPNTFYGINTETPSSGLDRLIKSVDGGRTWQVVTPLPDLHDSNISNRIAVTGDGKGIVIAGTTGLFVSNDQGAHFSKLDDAVMKNLSDVKISGNVMIVGYGLFNGGNSGVKIFDRKDGAWVARSSDHQPEPLNQYEAKQAAAGVCGAGYQAQSYVDGHCNFSAVAGQTVRSIGIDPKNPDVLYAGTGSGVRRWDPQNGWSDISHGVLSDSNVPNIQTDNKTGRLLMSTCNGIYQAQVDQPSEPVDPSQIAFQRLESHDFLVEGEGPLRKSHYGSLRTYEVLANPSNPDQIVAVADTGVYLSNDDGDKWSRVQSGALDDSAGVAKGKVSEFRSVLWLGDGSVEVSGSAGTFLFKP